MTEQQKIIDALTTALRFYETAWAFKTNKRYGGLEWSPTEDLLNDCGNTARDAIAALSASSTEERT